MIDLEKNKPTLAIYGIKDIKNNGYPAFVHDHNLSYFKEGQLLKYLQLERLTRTKYDNSMDRMLVELLKKEKLLNTDYDLVFTDNVIGRAFIDQSGEARFEAPLIQTLRDGLEEGKALWFGKERRAMILNHELAHIYSCLPFFGNFKENSLLIHFDGGASLSNFSAWHYHHQELKKVEYHWELKYLSSFFNANALTFAIMGAREFDQHSVPGKLMGFASYGSYQPGIEAWLKANDFFSKIWSKKSVFFSKTREDWGIELKSFDQKNSFIQDIAATVQYIFQRDFLDKLNELKEKTNARYLYYSGGSALNILTNSEIIRQKIFDDIFIPPCTNDSGLSVGAGALVEQIKHGKVNLHSPYLNNWGIEDYQTIGFDDLKAVATLLQQGKVVAVCNGPGEVGPRALGNRSILAKADSVKLARKVSQVHKKREWYRPVAPVMLEKNTRYFTGVDIIHPLSRYMLLDFSIDPAKRKAIEGVVHVDGTSRIQTLFSRNENPFLYDLLELLDTTYGIKALINTSFNQKGEPIVHSREDAMRSASAMQLDAVVINGKLYRLNPNKT
ncbi:MAG: carbamoyltransferase C-terminal domain-containing protein [Bacteroidales bacterium]|jgi:carbamoyltransferase|nr:carbamoyltransferase C-terminal domain-containing protein [Bacteroidales bacterium]